MKKNIEDRLGEINSTLQSILFIGSTATLIFALKVTVEALVAVYG